MAAKIEVAMKKSEAMLWARLDLPVPIPAAKENEPKKEADDEDGEDWHNFKRYKKHFFSFHLKAAHSSIPHSFKSLKRQNISDLSNIIS